MQNDSVKFKIRKDPKGPAPSLKNRYSSKPKAFGSCSAGFTLIEVTVTIMIFSIMMTLISGIFVRAVALERRVVWSQRVQENSTLIIEAMAREIRVSDITNQDSPSCTATALTMNHPTACGGSSCNIVYSLSGTNVLKQAGAVSAVINSSDVSVTRLNFCITGSGASDDQSPKVTILMSMSSSTGSPPAKADLETTITSRDITSELSN